MTSDYDGGKCLGFELRFCRYTELQLLRAFFIFFTYFINFSRIMLKFSEALKAAQEQEVRIARSGWNGKGMWVCVGSTTPTKLASDKFWNKHTKKFAEQQGGEAEVLPYMLMKTADNKIQMGWLASQSDLLANDWQILED